MFLFCVFCFAQQDTSGWFWAQAKLKLSGCPPRGVRPVQQWSGVVCTRTANALPALSRPKACSLLNIVTIARSFCRTSFRDRGRRGPLVGRPLGVCRMSFRDRGRRRPRVCERPRSGETQSPAHQLQAPGCRLRIAGLQVAGSRFVDCGLQVCRFAGLQFAGL